MGIIPDHTIRQLCIEQSMVVPFNEELLNPASLDVRLGDTLLVEVDHTRDLLPVNIEHTSQSDPYWLEPGEFVLAQTQEQFNIPNDIAARFALKSSRAREGIEHLLAGFADPGFHGAVMTLELQNARRLYSVPIWYGMKIGQMTFERMESPPEVSYAVKGHYNKDVTATASRGHL